jgi:hypothetical protein
VDNVTCNQVEAYYLKVRIVSSLDEALRHGAEHFFKADSLDEQKYTLTSSTNLYFEPTNDDLGPQ